MRPVLAQMPVQDYMPVPHIVTGTWGDVTLTRGEATSGLQMCVDYADQVAPGDHEIFDEVLTEQIQYDPVNQVLDVTAEYFQMISIG
ncbi:hypothetical protein HK097_009320 [Rhizophlyctis rosea]|uniref:Uncharacterized protein n=1 Tax=Rhizophlyctis rosea TaxID=64517 RepID=A0AAD5SAQ1_9FUNG|nr:hypothetical protein HK097_009320 [Rhizophlyctis rosea]